MAEKRKRKRGNTLVYVLALMGLMISFLVGWIIAMLKNIPLMYQRLEYILMRGVFVLIVFWIIRAVMNIKSGR